MRNLARALPRTETDETVPVRRTLIGVAVVAAAALVVWNGRAGEAPGDPPAPVDTSWSALDPSARCERAAQIITYRERWPTVCRWRGPGERLQGQAFPPPAGPPPYDIPRVEIYVAPAQTREELANAMAHEFGHMHHTREPTFAAEWLATRNLPPTTPPEVWTEDYAEVFAALFSPPSDRWRAPTPRPSPEALADLRARFFS